MIEVAAAGMAFVICVLGCFGGLVMSGVKRLRGVADWATLYVLFLFREVRDDGPVAIMSGEGVLVPSKFFGLVP